MKIFLVFLIATFLNFEKVESIQFECEYAVNLLSEYYCEAKELEITSRDDRTITEISGNHEDGKFNEDVKYFSCEEQTVNFFPLQLSIFFPNLERVEIKNSNLLEVQSSDLRQFRGNLDEIWLDNNQLEVLEANLFKFNPNLNEIHLNNNKIKHIEDGAFNGLKKLQSLFLRGNPCVDNFVWGNKTELLSFIPEVERKCKDSTRVATTQSSEEAKLNEEKEKYCAIIGELLKSKQKFSITINSD